MSAGFSLAGWLARLPWRSSCIQGGRRKAFYACGEPRGCYHCYAYDDAKIRCPEYSDHYYSLAEDWRGQHLPYPKLPRWAKRLWEWRVRLGVWLRMPCPTRGSEFRFQCPNALCGGSDFFSYRSRSCYRCGFRFDADLKPEPDQWQRPEFWAGCQQAAAVYDDPFQDD